MKKFRISPTDCIYFVRNSEHTSIISLYSMNWLVFITKNEFLVIVQLDAQILFNVFIYL